MAGCVCVGGGSCYLTINGHPPCLAFICGRRSAGRQHTHTHTHKHTHITADVALVTVPLGVLKKECIHFNPPLPKSKLNAIHRLGFGALNKVRGVYGK